MSASTIRRAVRDYIAPTAGLANTYKAEPHFVGEDAWVAYDGTRGTMAFVNIDNEDESRLVINGTTTSGQQITYDVALVLLYEYLIPPDEASPDDWVDGLDALIDALKVRFRADPHLGTGPGGVVWSAAQEDGALRIARDLPKQGNGVVRSWNVLTFKVTENVF
jgi:hypothetical protein